MMQQVYHILGFITFWLGSAFLLVFMLYKLLMWEWLMRSIGKLWRRTLIYQYYEYRWLKILLRDGKLKDGTVVTTQVLDNMEIMIAKLPRFKTNLLRDKLLSTIQQAKTLINQSPNRTYE
jgi:hypothetical protein